jgi:hypothetical protein
MADQLLFEQSNESQITTEPFINRQVVYVIDQNNGTYNGQIQLDTSSLSNSGKYASYSEAYFEVPLVITATADTAAAQIASVQGLQNAFSVGLKNGYYQLIHSISVEYNNTSVIQLTPYTNFYVNYKLMTTLGTEDVDKFGSAIGFYPDSAFSHDYGSQAAADPDGHGSVNNRNAPSLTNVYINTAATKTTSNQGFYNRQQKTTAFIPAQSTGTPIITAAQCGTIGKNFFQNTSAANANSKVWYVLAQIRLKDVADFFDKMPLVKGAYLRFIINTNTSTHSLVYTLDATAVPDRLITNVDSTTNVIQGGTSPVLVASAAGVATTPAALNQVLPQGGYSPATIAVGTLAANPYTFTVRCSIGTERAITPAVQHPTIQQCRLYVPLYTMNPAMEEQYLSLNRTKKVVYRDIYQYQVDVTTSNGQGTFNTLLTNGIPNPKAIIIIPHIAATSNNVSNGANPIAPATSPFASEPGTTSPYISFTNFNIQVAGVNIFTQNELYDFEQFRNELASINALNGGLVDGLTSGLIGFDEFSTNYRYYVADLSRRLPAEDKVPKSIQILGTVQASTNVTLYCFIEFEKEITIDLMTGAKLS